MAKTFKSTSTVYVVSGVWFNRDDFDFVEFEFESDSRNERNIKSRVVRENAACKTANDVKIKSIVPNTVTTSVTINASMDDIINACINAGIDVVYNDNDDASEEVAES